LGFVTEAFNGRENFICGFGPSIRLGLFVMALDEGADVGFSGKLSEPALDLISGVERTSCARAEYFRF
jgi:hypothetical protein